MAHKRDLNVKMIDDRGRPPVDEDHVAALAESMARVGLLNPITVWSPITGLPVKLIAGAHRLAAARRLKWKEIEGIVLDGTGADPRAVSAAAIAEIDENLVRRDLSPAERADLTARRKELYEADRPETKQGAIGNGRKKGRQVGEPTPDRFTAETAKRTGRSERDVQRDATRGKSLGSKTLARIVGTPLDKGSTLDALAKLPEPKREEIVAKVEAGEVVPFVKPAKPRVEDPVDIMRKALFRIEQESTDPAAVAIAREALERTT